MADFPSRTALVEIGKQALTTGNSLLSEDAVDYEGHGANIVVHTGASMAEEVAAQGSTLELSLYLDTAGEVSDAALDRLVWDRYGLTRLGASPSLGTVTFTRPTASYGAITLAAGTVLISDDGIRFVLTAAATFGAATLTTTATVRSALAGAGQRATAGTIEAFETTPDDSSITVTNAAGTTGDADKESNDEFASRARLYFRNARRGTLQAIEYGALQVAGVKFSVGTEVTDPDGVPVRYVKLQVADRLGECSAALASAVEAALDEWDCAGIQVEVVRATITYVTIVIEVTTRSGYDAATVADQVRAAIVSRLSALAPGETLYHHILIDAAKAVPGAIISDEAVTTPATALAPGDGEVFRTKLELIDIDSP